jgi:hypothetical protein
MGSEVPVFARNCQFYRVPNFSQNREKSEENREKILGISVATLLHLTGSEKEDLLPRLLSIVMRGIEYSPKKQLKQRQWCGHAGFSLMSLFVKPWRVPRKTRP